MVTVGCLALVRLLALAACAAGMGYEGLAGGDSYESFFGMDAPLARCQRFACAADQAMAPRSRARVLSFLLPSRGPLA